ncbi:hypothetical protein Tco_0622417 [Tanacetum coccineum]
MLYPVLNSVQEVHMAKHLHRTHSLNSCHDFVSQSPSRSFESLMQTRKTLIPFEHHQTTCLVVVFRQYVPHRVNEWTMYPPLPYILSTVTYLVMPKESNFAGLQGSSCIQDHFRQELSDAFLVAGLVCSHHMVLTEVKCCKLKANPYDVCYDGSEVFSICAKSRPTNSRSADLLWPTLITSKRTILKLSVIAKHVTGSG